VQYLLFYAEIIDKNRKNRAYADLGHINAITIIYQGISFNFTSMYVIKLIIIYVLDIQMDSPPPLSRHELQGASHTTGGLFRGKGYGNNPNIADLADQDDSLIPIIGKIYLYITTNDNPATWDFTMIKHHIVIKH